MVSGIERTPSSSSRDGDVRRAFFGLERRSLERLSTRVVPCTSGVAYLDDEYPTRYYSNLLLADADALSVDALIEDADATLVDREHRRIIVRPAGVGERLAPFFVEHGFEASSEVVMVHRRGSDRVGTAAVEELSFEEIAPLILEVYLEDGTLTEETALHFTQQHRKFERSIGARFFASRIDGELAGSCELWASAPDALVEHVGTLERFRGRGVARSVILQAMEAAGEAGAEHVFIVTDEDDWPKELYARLGFDPIGRDRTFTKVPA
jgi:ribosomal protein S18 acetylase RimI-like enzyme